uniref:sphingomyelin phosphodiesterase n=1 Tax=Paramoeba aestuarina TaxID=180227 RepID=A0A6U3CEY6_9EUKA|mmetsp:Transcript_39147/g.61961  ORF Transcript_39147/g.61961 Transcript_39147/m.61961 type:complete len:449 (+) Transcript_39147:34-1380(+)|eukprot:CAMPEP_0201526348 /NCGR_PEP_ID=MMETSP0161_2-20130828/31564_1 /ASSEMBLY_ACC=CAM_ASM_000251 /TAXON_ID=180227 /ORGANISM="Neoparamoeba aestuarina, Strain SoJaBio B1-5/56/2" /LENGTH=448 /DNA_ID=CAMNT_0047926707 /DNA_START=33 /DNA_END=1379 /DNA_ORIENTATION=+
MLSTIQRVVTLGALLLHSGVYILVILTLTLLCVLQDYVSTANASVAGVLSSFLVLSLRHEYRHLLKIVHGSSTKKIAQKDVCVEPQTSNPPAVRLLTYNIFCRPVGVRNNEDDFKNERLNLFLQEMEMYDVIALQEIFELFNTRPKFLIQAAQKVGFRYSLRGTWPSFASRKFIDAGLLILSKYPIVKYDHHIFKNSAEVDQFAAKQIMYAGISIEGKILHCFTSHTQATYGNNEGGAPKSGNPIYEWGQYIIKGGSGDAKKVVVECDEARVGQLRESREFIDRVLQNGEVLGKDDIGVLMGDLNVDALNCPHEYSTLLQTLSEGSNYHVSNAFFDEHGFHPVTYGDVCPRTGKNLETTLTAPMDVGMKGSLDHMIVFRRKKEGGDREREHDESEDDEKEGKRNDFDSPYRVEDVKVEPFFVKDQQPITQISDHYGISATLTPIREDR